jgi:predicted  nucleic acid-binding Zn-ribbon protein
MIEELQRKIEDVETKMREFERLGARLNEAQRLVATEADRLLRLKEQLAAILKKEYWNTMAATRGGGVARPGAQGAARGNQQRPGETLDRAAFNQVNSAVQAALRQSADLQARLAALVQSLIPAAPHAQPQKVTPPPQAVPAHVTPRPAASAVAAAPPAPPVPPSPAVFARQHPQSEEIVEGTPYVEPAAGHPATPVAAAPEAHKPAAKKYEGPSSAAAQAHPPAPKHEAAPVATAPSAQRSPSASEADEKAIAEAVATGRKALESLDRSIELGREVAQGGVWQTLKGAAHLNTAAHANLSEARKAASEAAENLRLFHEQVRELRHRVGDKADLGRLETLGDELLDALSAETGDQPKVHEALAAAHESYHQVRGLCARLQLDAAAVRSRLAALRRGIRKTPTEL